MSTPSRLQLSLNGSQTRGYWGPWPFANPAAIVHVVDADYEGPRPAPAWYNPATGDAYVDIQVAKGDPNRDYEADVNAKVAGLVTHELAHSRWSTWRNADLTNDSAVSRVLTLLEELRIESFAVNAKPERVPRLLRASLDIVLEGSNAPITDQFGAAFRWSLIYGRVLGGVIDHEKLGWLDIQIRTMLGDDVVDALEDILGESLTLGTDDRDLRRLVKLAERFVDLVGRPEKEDGHGGCDHGEGGDESTESEATGGGGTPEEGESENTGGAGEKGDDAEADDSDGKGSGKDDDSDGSDDAENDSPDDREDRSGSVTDVRPVDKGLAEGLSETIGKIVETSTTEWDDEPVVLSDPKKVGPEVFGKKSKRGSRYAPDAGHRRLTATVARKLDELVLPTITKKAVSSKLPPGKLKAREALRARAELSQGMMSTARPWKGTKRTHTVAKVMRVGIMTDTSGSMRWAERAVAAFAYVWSNAGHRVGARTAAVTFGDDAHAVTHPGELSTEIKQHPADGGGEAFDRGAAAIDYVLNLSARDGAAKVLIVVSDGELVNHLEPEKALKWIDQWEAAGTKVVWLTPETYTRLCRRLAHRKQTVVKEVDRHDAFKAIHDAAMDALTEIIRTGGA